jgi:trehalose/maltose hydrolase-like predicted phosphorylase
VNGWSLVYEGFDPAQERLRETLCTLGNGYFATRGAAPESPAGPTHYPGTYLAGCYNRLPSVIDGRTLEHEDLVNAPNWLPLAFRCPGSPWLSLPIVEVLAYRQELDLRHGVLLRDMRVRDSAGRTTRVQSVRLVHMADPHLAALETTITPEDWSGPLEIRAALDGRVVNSLVGRYRHLANQHLAPVETAAVGDDGVALKVRTCQSEILIAQAARIRVFRGDRRVGDVGSVFEEPGYVARDTVVEVEAGTPVRVEKVAALYTSRDRAISECGLEARTAIGRAGSFDELLQTHARAWEHLWWTFGMELEVDADPVTPGNGALATNALVRLHIFHLLQTASPHTRDLDVGVLARGLHGEAYRGHVFWDELFVFPFLNLRMPEITRALLLYRYRRLGEARVAARAAGYRGAMFPWQSGSNGREETDTQFFNPRSGRWMADHSHLQRHVGAAIAYNVWQYYEVTGDLEFLVDYGAEMLLDMARFWASATTYDPRLERYEIRGMMGPDEYHDRYPGADRFGLNNNAYTNVMAAWVLARAGAVLDVLPTNVRRRLVDRLAITDRELAEWDTISRRMRLVFHADGILSQFEGYETLKEFDWEGYRQRYGHLYRLDFILEAEGDSTNAYKLSKQPDVLMLFYLFSFRELQALFERLGYPFDDQTMPRTISYYYARSAHDSSLSRVADSWVLARADRPGSWDVFMEALVTDVADIQGGTTPEGIHLGAMAGTVDLLQRCYTGIELRGDVLRLSPRLPKALRRLRLFVRYRGQSLELELTGDAVEVNAAHCCAPAIRLAINGETYEVAAAERRRFPLR